MLSFVVYSNGKLARELDLLGAYLIGSDDVPLRAELSFKNGIVSCTKRAAGPAGLALMWNVRGVGSILIETVRLPERKQPYVLAVELARGRLMRINHKLEDWGLYDYEGTDKIIAKVTKAREMLIKALQADTRPEAATLGDEALSLAVRASETLSDFHAEIFLDRRKQSGSFGPRVVGCTVNLDKPIDLIRKRISPAFDFAAVPISWRDVEPSEQTFNWTLTDTWIEALAKDRVPIKGVSLLSFHEKQVPDWLYIWEHDFDTIRDLAFEHVRRVINRYGQYIQAWNVISGIHVDNCFSFNFEQLMELTRMAAALTKQAAPDSLAIIDMVAPWGEYYARNQRTIPPLLYADMVVQSGVNLDAFGLQFFFGVGVDGMFVRDMFQISSLLDAFAKLGKPLHISATQVPSSPVGQQHEGTDHADGGAWRRPWSEDVQAQWLRHFLTIALSKPFVESVSWHTLVDDDQGPIPNGGLLRPDLAAKPAYQQAAKFRSEVHSGS